MLYGTLFHIFQKKSDVPAIFFRLFQKIKLANDIIRDNFQVFAGIFQIAEKYVTRLYIFIRKLKIIYFFIAIH
jgi:hypothetical protein